MKIKQEHFAELKTMIESSSVFPALLDYREKGLSDMRYRWDCLWSTNVKDRTALIDAIYQYANDNHIDTALRKITGTK